MAAYINESVMENRAVMMAERVTNLIFNLGINKETFDKALELINRRDVFGYGHGIGEYKQSTFAVVDDPGCQS